MRKHTITNVRARCHCEESRLHRDDEAIPLEFSETPGDCHAPIEIGARNDNVRKSLFVFVFILFVFSSLTLLFPLQKTNASQCTDAGGTCRFYTVGTSGCSSSETNIGQVGQLGCDPGYLCCKPTSTTGLGCGGGMGPLAEFLCGLTGSSDEKKVQIGNKFNSVLSSIIGFLTAAAGLWFLIQFILAGIAWISAGGDKGSLETARNKIFNSVIGLIIVVSAYVLVGVVGSILGLNILNPGEILQNLGIQ